MRKLASATEIVNFSCTLAEIACSQKLKILFTPWKQCFMEFLWGGRKRLLRKLMSFHIPVEETRRHSKAQSSIFCCFHGLCISELLKLLTNTNYYPAQWNTEVLLRLLLIAFRKTKKETMILRCKFRIAFNALEISCFLLVVVGFFVGKECLFTVCFVTFYLNFVWGFGFCFVRLDLFL